MKNIKSYLKIISFFAVIVSCNQKEKEGSKEVVQINQTQEEKKDTIAVVFDQWQEGYLDIHHINTGRGDTSIIIMPDGTTILFDAGLIEKEKWEKSRIPLKVVEPRPTDSLSAAKWISMYTKKVVPAEMAKTLDYAVISHFHKDHYGSFVELNDFLPFNKIIDRNYPDYNFPVDLRKHQLKNGVLMKYLDFIDSVGIPTEALQVGSDSQIKLLNNPKKYPNFKIRNVKSNATIWTGKDDETFEYFTAKEMTDYYKGKYNENPLSLALKISYGDFDYFTGGDNTGMQGFGLPYWFDVETPIAKAVGEVESLTLNHHGNRDATNEFFVNTLNPKVVVQQSWCSDHPGQEVFHRLIYKDKNAHERAVFATDIHDETKVTYGPWFIDNYKSMQGHIVIRVHPGGRTYEVVILNDDSTDLMVKQKFGPYQSF